MLDIKEKTVWNWKVFFNHWGGFLLGCINENF